MDLIEDWGFRIADCGLGMSDWGFRIFEFLNLLKP
jgi:hypothetical protein